MLLEITIVRSSSPTLTDEVGDLGQRGNNCHGSALDAVLHSLCPSHRSLLYQILKLARQEKMLFHKSHCCHYDVNPKEYITPNAVPFSECKAHNNSPCCPLTVCDNQSHGSTMYHPGDCKSNCRVHHCSLTDCKSEGPLSAGSCCLQRSRVETYTVLCPKRLHCISCQSLAVSRINNIVCTFASSPSPSRSPSLCTPSPSLCPSSSICCNLHNPHSFPCYSSHTCQTQENTVDRVGDVDPPCPILQREQSPSPPPLSPIPSDIDKKTDEKPPSLLHHGQEDGSHPTVRTAFMSHEETAAEKEREFRKWRDSQAEQKASGTSVQDVVNRFSEKLETITPLEKDPPLPSSTGNISEKEQQQCPSTSHDFHADAHLTEIITTVLHTGSASDYNLSELFNHHNSKEAKSPNTRSRSRQVFAAMTSVDDASTRRQSLQIKRELAKLDPTHSRRKKPPAKRAKLKDENGTSCPLNTTDSNFVKEESKKEMKESVENDQVPQNPSSAETDKNVVKEEIQTVIITEEVQIIKGEEKENEIFSDGKDLTLLGTQIITPEVQNKLGKQDSKVDIVETEKPCDRPHEEDGIGCVGGSKKKHEEVLSVQGSNSDQRSDKDQDCDDPNKDSQTCLSHHSMEARRSRRQIVPPKRFSSYVTEPRFYIACFTENIFNQRVPKDKVLTSSTLNTLQEDTDAKDAQPESSETPLSSLGQQGGLSDKETNSLSTSKVCPQNVAGKEKISLKCSSDNGTDGSECGAKPFGRLRSSPKRQRDTITDASNASTTCAGSAPNSQVQYISPIKVMIVLPVKDKEGIRYSLKSAGSACSGQAEEHFDPCEESSWSGTPQKLINPNTESATSGVKSVSLPLKSATSPAKSMSPTPKSTPSPAKSLSSTPKSASSPSKCPASPAKSISPTPRLASSPAKSLSSPNKSSSAKSGSSPNKSVTSPAKSGSSPNKYSPSPAKSGSSPNKSVASPAKCRSSPNKYSLSPAKSVSSPAKSGSSPNKSSPTRSGSSPNKSSASPAKCVSSPAKSGSSPNKSSPTRSGSSPNKSSASPVKSVSSPKSASSSPRANSRRSGEGTPTKRAAGSESHRFSGESPSFLETTPPKRRPGRPKKLGPQLEKKAKRPIGRPRKQQAVDEANGTKSLNAKADAPSDVEENMNKNLKITVVYGRSRRNKRTVSEGFDHLQTEFHALQAAGLKGNLGMLMPNSNTSSESTKTAVSKELNLVSPMKNCLPHSSSNIKCQKKDDSAPSRKPGRPAKVKISGISVTVNTVSPRQRKIQINKDIHKCCKALIQKKAHPESETAKEPRTISYQSTKKSIELEESKGTKDESEDKLPNQQVAVRHSMRVKKPSIHFLHAVATSTYRSYSHSNALLRRSKQLLLNKASNERKQVEQQKNMEPLGKKGQSCEKGRKNTSPDLSKVAGVSVDSIFSPKETLRWWAASAEEKTMNQELVRRIRLISDTWVSDSVENQDKEINSKLGNKGNRKSKHSSVVRTLFDCPPNKPRSCSMQQICSWFMETTETQSLAIVKKASSRNPYEVMHFPRSANKQMVCPSPQAERLRKHIKKFAKVVPKSPLQHQQAQKRLRKRTEEPLSPHFRRRLFTPKCAAAQPNQGSQWRRSRIYRVYQATLFRARTRFLNKKERKSRQKRQRNRKVAKHCSDGHATTGLQPKCKLLTRSAKDHLSECLESRSAANSVDQTQEPVDVPKEQNLCSKAWSPETLKECRVFLRKINSPDNESIEEEWDSCTVTLDNGLPSAYLFAGRETELVEVVKAVKTERKRGTKRAGELAGSSPKSVQELDEEPAGRQKGKCKSPGVVSTEPPQPPPAKMLRQSRMRGLTGPRWCDFVFEN